MKIAAARRSQEDISKRYGYQYAKLKNDNDFKIFWDNMKKKLISIQAYIDNYEIKKI